MSLKKRIVLPLVLLVVAAVCVRLGAWQVHRLRERRAANRAAEAALARPLVDLDTLTSSGAGITHRRVRATGHYDRAHEMVIRGMTRSDLPGVYVLTPLVLPDSSSILVNRGFVPAPDALSADLDGLDEPGNVTVTGIALPVDSADDRGKPLAHAGRTTWARLDRAALHRLPGAPRTSVYLLQQPDSTTPPLPRRLDAPAYDDGPHLSYAIQWFAFALTAVIVGGILLRSSATGADRRAPR